LCDHEWYDRYLHKEWFELDSVVNFTDNTNTRLSKLVVNQPSNCHLVITD